MKKLNGLSRLEMKEILGGTVPVCTDEYIDECSMYEIANITTNDPVERDILVGLIVDACYKSCINPL